MNVKWDEPVTWLGALGVSVGPAVAALTLRDARKKGARERKALDDAAIERARLAAVDAANQSLGGWKEMVGVLRGERDELLKRIEHLQTTVDELRREMRSGFDQRDGMIDLLRGENRQLKQLSGSLSKRPELWPDTPDYPAQSRQDPTP